MIVRPEQNWLRKLFSWHGSIMRKISLQMLFFVGLNIAYLFILPILHVHGIVAKESPVYFIGVSISIFLGFRNNVAWGRYSEARKLWGELLIVTRSLMREFINTSLASYEEKKAVVDLLIAYATVLKDTLRHEPVAAAMCEDRLIAGAGVMTPCNALLQEIGLYLYHNRPDTRVYQNYNHYLNQIGMIQGGCERISNTPIPFAYSLLLHRTVAIFCAIYPLLLISNFGVLTLLFSLFTTYALLALDAIATELEDPFGHEDNDLPLGAICNTIEIDLREMMQDAELPEKMRPDKHFRLL
ncbi:hypothetical protein RI834_001016 [Pluralibacter gergoviae]|nr:hypothetical protein [Pluralibacter gergoviae]